MIKKTRIKKGYTQEEIARKLDISLRHYQNIEQKKTLPSVVIGLRLSLILDVSPYWLFDVIKNIAV